MPEIVVDTRFPGRVSGPVSAAGSAGVGGERRGRSGAGRECADRVQNGGELVLPGPAGWHSERPLAACARQPGGDLQQLSSAGAGGLDGLVGRPIRVASVEVVRSAAIMVEALLALMRPEGKSAGVFQVADHQLNVARSRRSISATRVGTVRLVAKQWWRQSGNSSACAPIRRVRRTISLKPFSSVSAICASPSSG